MKINLYVQENACAITAIDCMRRELCGAMLTRAQDSTWKKNQTETFKSGRNKLNLTSFYVDIDDV